MATFGVTSTGTGIVLNNVKKSESVDIAEARNATGKVTDRQAYSKKTTITADGILSGEAPSAGTAMTIGGVAGIIESCEVTEANTDFQKVSITVSTIDGVAGTAYSSSSSGT